MFKDNQLMRIAVENADLTDVFGGEDDDSELGNLEFTSLSNLIQEGDIDNFLNRAFDKHEVLETAAEAA